MKVTVWLRKSALPSYATSTPRLQQTLTRPFKMQHCSPPPDCYHSQHMDFSPPPTSLCGTLLHPSVLHIQLLSMPHKSGIKSERGETLRSLILSCPTFCVPVIQKHPPTCSFFSDDCPYNQSSNPIIIQSNWTPRILQSHGSPLPSPASRCDESKRKKKRGLLRINRFFFSFFLLRSVTVLSASTVETSLSVSLYPVSRADRKPLRKPLQHSPVCFRAHLTYFLIVLQADE